MEEKGRRFSTCLFRRSGYTFRPPLTLDHVIVFDRRHFVRLMRSYLEYYHEDRCHSGLAKDVLNARVVTTRPSSDAKIVALPRVGGLHHHYEWRGAA